MTPFKILVTSQKGGVGKSTIAANLAAYFQREGQAVTLLDFDPHASSSTWLKRAPQTGVQVHPCRLSLDQGFNRSVMDARLHLRRTASGSQLVVGDLTWTDAMASELMLEFDLVIVPTSVAEIELAATEGFLLRHRRVFESTLRMSPTLLLCPTRVQAEQLKSDVFSKQRFPISFMLSPPVLEALSAREMFENGYLMDLQDACGASFTEFCKAVAVARELHVTAQASFRTKKAQRWAAIANPVAHIEQTRSLPKVVLSARTLPSPVENMQVYLSSPPRIPQFLKRMTTEVKNEL